MNWCFGTNTNMSVVQSCRGRLVLPHRGNLPENGDAASHKRSADRTVPRLSFGAVASALHVRPDHPSPGRALCLRPSWLILPVAYACLKV
ncbi:unnamed protein product [Merluccius merluccius]